jgi:RNA polymerase sigma-70 factor (ECF subfamily)
MDEADTAIRAQLAAGDLRGAATATLRLYGAEIYGFLKAMARDDDLGAEAFAQLGEDLWRGLPSFRGDGPLRAWCYSLARNALHRLRRDPRRKRERNVALSSADVADLAAEIRSATAVHQRTAVKDDLRAVRESLDPDDHELLILRLDRKMSWKDIARVQDGDLADAALTARAAALRKRFERVKATIRERIKPPA